MVGVSCGRVTLIDGTKIVQYTHPRVVCDTEHMIRKSYRLVTLVGVCCSGSIIMVVVLAVASSKIGTFDTHMVISVSVCCCGSRQNGRELWKIKFINAINDNFRNLVLTFSYTVKMFLRI